ncbi:PBP1A family penicillin-binding protein [Bacillus shivajii]|uniref:transglycosylase domain-containing protein n=1 Tax=Bacillus shivajii TaxID=1983719 RepID=UPI001CFA85E5|nr:PBP1A family penicillin-binding protein [Bacillus shivajii]UCZ53067.1 PBP1A family penicillin-binding protein [Bacillus shivajii]
MEVLTRKAYHRRKRLIGTILKTTTLFLTLSLGAVAATIAYAYQMEPPSLSVPETTVMYSSDSEVIGELHRGQNRHWIPIEDMGEEIIEATLAVEDRRFYNHYGFDFFRIGGAVLTNLRSGMKVQGASTITQQYARNLYLHHDKTWTRKFHEAMYALRLELHYTKEEILEGYLNTIYYGHGAYGIEAAANLYFQKNADELNVAEAAMLAGIPKGPRIYSPFINEENAKTRQETVLMTMEEASFITNNERQTWSEYSFSFASNEEIQAKKVAPYFQEMVTKWLVDDLGLEPEVIDNGGLEIHTTLNVDMQKTAEKLIEKQLANKEDLQTGFVALNPRNGEVLALVGGRDYEESQFNRVTQASRHPGSTIKPILYYAALENGLRPNSMLKSEETTFIYDEGREEYSPRNFNHKFADDYITMLQALAISDNIFAMKTHFLLGFDTLIKTAERFGIDREFTPLPTLALGSQNVGVLEMTNSYSPFANGGFLVEPHFVTKITDRDGEVLYEANVNRKKELNPAYTAIMTNMMEGMFEASLNASHASVTGGSLAHLFDRPIAGKSGSTDADSWMIGFTPQLLSGVWVGYDEGQWLQPGDEAVAKNVWGHFMKEALEDELKLSFQKPQNVVEVNINPENGLLATDACPVSRKTAFYAGTEPTEHCSEHIDSSEIKEDKKFDPQKKEDEKKEKFLDRLIKWFE